MNAYKPMTSEEAMAIATQDTSGSSISRTFSIT